jgi:hypothetical protein
MKNDIFNKISPNEALEILRQIAKTDKNSKGRIIGIAEEIFRSVDIEAVCDDVFRALDAIDVHELWDRSGPKTDGYASPQDMAVEMFEEASEPYLQELRRLFDLKMHQEAKHYCMGILKGIYLYEDGSGSEFKDWATDVPGECFGYVLNEWKKINSNKRDKKAMKDFISSDCPDWSISAINQL